jgi:hypothetical protein
VSRARVSALGLSPDPHHNRAIPNRFFILHAFIGKAHIREKFAGMQIGVGGFSTKNLFLFFSMVLNFDNVEIFSDCFMYISNAIAFK